MSKNLEPRKIISLSDEEGRTLDFWAVNDDTCHKVSLSIKCSDPLAEDDVLEALSFFIHEVEEKAITFLNRSEAVKH
jgi:hypothetical protein